MYHLCCNTTKMSIINDVYKFYVSVSLFTLVDLQVVDEFFVLYKKIHNKPQAKHLTIRPNLADVFSNMFPGTHRQISLFLDSYKEASEINEISTKKHKDSGRRRSLSRSRSPSPNVREKCFENKKPEHVLGSDLQTSRKDQPEDKGYDDDAGTFDSKNRILDEKVLNEDLEAYMKIGYYLRNGFFVFRVPYSEGSRFENEFSICNFLWKLRKDKFTNQDYHNLGCYFSMYKLVVFDDSERIAHFIFENEKDLNTWKHTYKY